MKTCLSSRSGILHVSNSFSLYHITTFFKMLTSSYFLTFQQSWKFRRSSRLPWLGRKDVICLSYGAKVLKYSFTKVWVESENSRYITLLYCKFVLYFSYFWHLSLLSKFAIYGVRPVSAPVARLTVSTAQEQILVCPLQRGKINNLAPLTKKKKMKSP